MLPTYNYDLFSKDENIEKKMQSLQNYLILFEQTKNSNTFTELNALMQLLESSFIVFEEHLVIDLFSHCEKLCCYLNARKQLAHLYFLLGMTYFKQTEYKIASTHFIHSAKIAASSALHNETIIAYCYTANCFLQITDYEKALNYTKTAFWLRNKHQNTDSFVLNHIYYHFCLIYKRLKLPYVDYYMCLLDDFLETDGSEQDKGKIYLLKASIEEDAENYNKEYENLKLALVCYLKTYNLNRQIIVLNSILNCPASIKTSSEQNQYLIQLKKIEQKFKLAYSGFSFKKQLLQFDIDKTKYPLLTYDLNNADFQNICENTLTDQPYLFIVALKDQLTLTAAQNMDHYKSIEEILFKEIDNDTIISSFFEDQLLFLIQKRVNIHTSSLLNKITERIQTQIGPISFGYAQADSDTISCRKLYNHAYVNFYYNHTN